MSSSTTTTTTKSTTGAKPLTPKKQRVKVPSVQVFGRKVNIYYFLLYLLTFFKKK